MEDNQWYDTNFIKEVHDAAVATKKNYEDAPEEARDAIVRIGLMTLKAYQNIVADVWLDVMIGDDLDAEPDPLWLAVVEARFGKSYAELKDASFKTWEMYKDDN